ncbi:hypothetical protein E2P81_ATG06787 [Venturia nashicola]|nr:hypothetical protein E2P81_ATG06787 [Venturia nashicola]
MTGPAAPTITPAPECKACLLQAASYRILTYDGSGKDVQNATVAKIWEIPYVDLAGNTFSVSFSTETYPQDDPGKTPNVTTEYFSPTWTELGAVLTYPTTYIAYENIGFVPECTGAISPLNLAQPTSPAQLVFPANQDFGNVSRSIAGYLESLHPSGNITDLRQCSFAVGTADSKNHHGNLPIPFGPRVHPVGDSNNNTQPTGTSLPDGTITLPAWPTTGSPAPTDNDTLPLVGITAEPPPLNEPTAVVNKVSVALLTVRGEKPPIVVARQQPEPTPVNPPSPELPNEPPSPAEPLPAPVPLPVITNPAVQPPDQPPNPGPPIIAPRPTGASQGVGDFIASALGFTPADKPAQPGGGISKELTPPSAPQVVDIGGKPYTIAPVGPSSAGGTAGQPGNAPAGDNRLHAPGVAVGGQIIQPGQSATINGQVVSVPNGGGNLIVGGTTIAVNNLPPAPTPPTLTFGGNTITGDPSSGFVVAPGITALPGGPAVTVGDTTISIAPGGSIALINGQPQILASKPSTVPVLTIGDQAIAGSISGTSTAFVLAPGQTLTPGGSLTISGTTYSLPADGGSVVVINGMTSQLGSSPTMVPVLSLGTQTITASVSDSGTSFVFAPGLTLTPGGSLVVLGTTFSLPASEPGIVVVNGQTSTLGQAALATEAPALTIDGHVYPATVIDGKTVYDLGSGTTLIPGGIITLPDGTKVTLASDGSSLVFGTSTSKIGDVPEPTSANTTSSNSSSLSSDRGSANSNSMATTKKKNGGTSSLAASALMGTEMALMTVFMAFVSLL